MFHAIPWSFFFVYCHPLWSMYRTLLHGRSNISDKTTIQEIIIKKKKQDISTHALICTCSDLVLRPGRLRVDLIAPWNGYVQPHECEAGLWEPIYAPNRASPSPPAAAPISHQPPAVYVCVSLCLGLSLFLAHSSPP